MKVIKALGWLLVLVVVFVGLSLYLTANNLNSLVKQAVEQVGTETLQTKVSLVSADISLTEARATLSGLTIHNPPGFTAENIFELGEIGLDLNLEAMLDKVVDISEIKVNGLRVVAEQKGTSTNIQTLLNTVSGSGKTEAKPADSKSPDNASPDVLMKVGKFEFADSTVTLVTEKWGEQQIPLPAITLQKLGGDKGVPPDQLSQVVISRLLKDVNRAVEKKMKALVKEKAKEKLEEKEDELKDKYRSELKDKLGDDADQVEGSLKSLLSR